MRCHVGTAMAAEADQPEAAQQVGQRRALRPVVGQGHHRQVAQEGRRPVGRDAHALLGGGLPGGALGSEQVVGHPEAAASVEAAVLADLEAREPGQQRRTPEVGDAIAARVAG